MIYRAAMRSVFKQVRVWPTSVLDQTSVSIGLNTPADVVPGLNSYPPERRPVRARQTVHL